jgi:uncharacterized damage-inducible protein DinB
MRRQLDVCSGRQFDHQIHHSGQVQAVLTSQLGKTPEPDFLIFQRLSVKSAA